MNRLRHLFIILKPEFQGEGISLLPWSFNSLKMPLTQVVTIGTYSQLEKMESPTFSALSSSLKSTSALSKRKPIHEFTYLKFFMKIKGVILAEKKLVLEMWNIYYKNNEKIHTDFGAASTQKKTTTIPFQKKKSKLHSRDSTPTIQKIIQPLQLDFQPPF